MTPQRSALHSVSAETFTDPRTRTLLSHTGSTTNLLEHLLDEHVKVHTLDLAHTVVDQVCPEAAAPLRLPAGASVLVRRTTLGSARHQISRNLVLAPLGRLPWTDPLLRSCTTPLGLRLPQPHERHPLGHGLDSWGPGRAAAARWYLIVDNAQPALFIRETFNPDLFDPATTCP
ncbi:hypothetical protein [Nonomuraea sp. NPDC005650]|uniref:hypothetical protein n=1 Tax=Nonomuraea sp. NPDC005650 TaxID=3157045 RepID=UPI00339DB8D0